MPSESRTKYYKKRLGRLVETYQIRGGSIEAPFTVLELRDKAKGAKEPGNDGLLFAWGGSRLA